MSRLRIAIVGPTHPYKGGVASHTTTLAHELSDAGHDVTLVAWSHMYPTLLYPGEQEVPGGRPDVEPFPRTVRALSWARPDTWVRTGRRLRDFDAIVVVHVIPPIVPAHLTLLKAAGIGRTSSTGIGPRSIVIAHNVLPHERHPGDTALMHQFLTRVDSVIVHSEEQAAAARELGAPVVAVADLPPHLPGGMPLPRAPHDGPPRMLAMGLVRDYKGVDLLIEAMKQVPGPTLTVAGEVWGETGQRLQRLAEAPELAGRVTFRPGYVPADELAGLLAEHEVLTLTYRSATASQNALLGQQHGMVVLASRVGTFGEQVHDGADGLLVEPGDVGSIADALRRLAEPDELRRLADGVRPPDLSAPWGAYLETLASLATPRERNAPARRSLPAILSTARAAVSAARRPAVELTPQELGETRPTDVLTDTDVAADVRAGAVALGLARCRDEIAAWAAYGALGAVLAVDPERRRSAVIVDESGPSSPFAGWARTAGFIPLELAMIGERSSVSALDLPPASIDVITRIHPEGCDADDVDGAIAHAAWALRPAGLLILTLPLGEPGVAGALDRTGVAELVARAGEQGFELVGELPDADAMARPGDAEPGEAYGLVRLTLARTAAAPPDPAAGAGR
ncbi:MAG: glycosyltransferase family 4 protein [Micrococcales bacterium]|nr:glycosyltransferase family 4 protein [Micrococcales bacterium]